jgi:hypothetical protein
VLNETARLTQIEEGMCLGFNAIMVENEGLELDEYRALVKQADLPPENWASEKVSSRV